MSPTDPRHGTYAGGRLHREVDEDTCDACKYAEARYERARQLDILNGRPRSIGATGTQRRLQALAALGHTWGRIGEALGMTASGAHHLATKNKAYVRATTAAKVHALFDAWSMTLPPETTTTERKNASYARGVARKRSWNPPLAWEGVDVDDPAATPDLGDTAEDDDTPEDDVDPVVIERILAGDPTPARTATPTERHLVVTAWVERTGRPINDLARLTGWQPNRYRNPPTTTEEHNAA